MCMWALMAESHFENTSRICWPSSADVFDSFKGILQVSCFFFVGLNVSIKQKKQQTKALNVNMSLNEEFHFK